MGVPVPVFPYVECEQDGRKDDPQEERPILDEVINYSIRFMERVREIVNRHGVDFPIPEVLPLSSGGLELQWVRTDKAFRVIFENSGTIYVMIGSTSGHVETPVRMSVMDVVRSLCSFLGAEKLAGGGE